MLPSDKGFDEFDKTVLGHVISTDLCFGAGAPFAPRRHGRCPPTALVLAAFCDSTPTLNAPCRVYIPAGRIVAGTAHSTLHEKRESSILG